MTRRIEVINVKFRVNEIPRFGDRVLMLLEVGDGIAKTRIPSMLDGDVLMKQTLRPECQSRTHIWMK